MNNNRKILYLDIETTGLSARRSHLTVIGAGFLGDQGFTVRQFFVGRPSEECEVLASFLEFASSYDLIVNYNGSTFDLPYLREKCRLYGLDPLSGTACLDLMKDSRRCAKIFGLDSLKLVNVCAFFNIGRDDCSSGADCIELYRRYLETGEKRYADVILEHNRDDIVELYKLMPITTYSELLDGRYTPELLLPSDAAVPGDIRILLTMDQAFPKDFSIGNSSCSLSGSGLTAEIRIRPFACELKYFFENYKDYYYLPSEDRAIHKSVASFLPSAGRKKATASTAYERQSGVFYHQPSDIIKPCFKTNRVSSELFFELKGIASCCGDIDAEDKLRELSHGIINELLS